MEKLGRGWRAEESVDVMGLNGYCEFEREEWAEVHESVR